MSITIASTKPTYPTYSTLPTFKRWCKIKNTGCEFATDYGYCQLTVCIQRRIENEPK